MNPQIGLSRAEFFLQMSHRDGSARYVKNRLYNTKCPYNPQFLKVEFTPSNFAALTPSAEQNLPVKVSYKGVCNYCKHVCYLDMDSLAYAKHMDQVHHLNVPNSIIFRVDPAEHLGSCNLPKIECELYSQFTREQKPPSGLRNEYRELDLSGLEKTVVYRQRSRMQEFIEVAGMNYLGLTQDVQMDDFLEGLLSFTF